MKWLLALAITAIYAESAAAQSPSVLQLDQQAAQARSDYLSRLEEVASGYEDAGQTDKAKDVLRQILELNPDAKAVREQLDELENRVFETKSVTVDVDASRGWTAAGLFVEKDKPIRLEAEGSYKFIANLTLGPEGVATEDLSRDVAAGVGFGKLMGLVVAPPKPGGQDKQPRPGTPFAVGTKTEFMPEADGLLLLRLNIPAGTKSNGKVKVAISGNIRRFGSQ